MIERTAICACGAIGMTARGEPARVSLCHCGACKRRTGGAFSLNATWPEGALVITGECPTASASASKRALRARFLLPGVRHAGLYRIELRPGMVSIPVGLFADADFPPPRFEVYAELAMRGLGLTITPPGEQL